MSTAKVAWREMLNIAGFLDVGVELRKSEEVTAESATEFYADFPILVYRTGILVYD